MLTFAIKLKDLLLREDGQDLVEYVLIISLIALACLTGVGGFGVLLQGLLTTINAAAASIFG
jgi:Flp pilus assembly pilin Flp